MGGGSLPSGFSELHQFASGPGGGAGAGIGSAVDVSGIGSAVDVAGAGFLF